MNRLSAIVIALCLGLTTLGARAKPKVPPTPEEIAKKAAQPVVGTVLKVDGTNIVIQTHGKDAGEVKVQTDAKTKFEINGSAVTLEKIKPGMSIAASPREGVATKVAVNEEPKKSKKKDSKKK